VSDCPDAPEANDLRRRAKSENDRMAAIENVADIFEGGSMMEPSMLELRGALGLLSAAKKTIRMSGWEGTHYHHATKAASEAYSLLSDCWCAVNKDLKAMLGQNKEFTQAAALLGVK
jgi:hypothetical protein